MPLSARAFLLKLSNNRQLKALLTRNGMSQGLVRRFVADETLPEALATAHALQAKHIRTALGLDQSDTLALSNLMRIAGAARAQNNAFVRVDMEGSMDTPRTLEIVRAAHSEYAHLGTVLQSSLRRTDTDLQTMIKNNIPIRLVNGAYADPPNVASPAKADVDTAYMRQMRTLLASNVPAAIATHDEAIIRDAKRFVREQRIPNHRFEFQMLLGVRRDLQEALAQEGCGVRAYVPFGRTWSPYFMRRLAERPANIGFILKSLVRP